MAGDSTCGGDDTSSRRRRADERHARRV